MLEELEKLDKNLEVIYLGSASAVEKKMLARLPIKYEIIPTGKFRRYNRGIIKASLDVKTNWQNLVDALRVNRGVIKAIKILKKFRPDMIFIKGGYVGLPVGIAAKILKIPYINHESDIIFGVTNKLLSRWSEKTAVGFPIELYSQINQSKLFFTGNPLRISSISGDQLSAQKYFKLSPLIPTILIFGGSIGSASINKLVFSNLSLLSTNYQIIHITGDIDIKEAKEIRNKLATKQKNNYHPYAFLTNKMGLAYCIADLVIARAGANSIAEIAYWAKPSIIIPLATSANNHQHVNADILKRYGASRVLYEKNLTGLRFVAEIDRLMSGKNDRDYLSKNIKKLAKFDASKLLADLLYKLFSNKK